MLAGGEREGGVIGIGFGLFLLGGSIFSAGRDCGASDGSRLAARIDPPLPLEVDLLGVKEEGNVKDYDPFS